MSDFVITLFLMVVTFPSSIPLGFLKLNAYKIYFFNYFIQKSVKSICLISPFSKFVLNSNVCTQFEHYQNLILESQNQWHYVTDFLFFNEFVYSIRVTKSLTRIYQRIQKQNYSVQRLENLYGCYFNHCFMHLGPYSHILNLPLYLNL